MATKTIETAFFVVLSLCEMLSQIQGAPVKSSVSYADFKPTSQEMYQWLWATSLQLSSLVGHTQADFAQLRLGDQYYDTFVHKIPGISGPMWNADRLSDQSFLREAAEKLFLFADLLNGIYVHESQSKDSDQFAAKFRQIIDEINFLITYIQNVEVLHNYPVTHRPNVPQPTQKPNASQKEQNEWELGVLKELLYWLIPVTGEFHNKSMAS